MEDIDQLIDSWILRTPSAAPAGEMDRFLVDSHAKLLLSICAQGARYGLSSLAPAVTEVDDPLVKESFTALGSGAAPETLCARLDEAVTGDGIPSVMTGASVLLLQEGRSLDEIHRRLNGICGFHIEWFGLEESDPRAVTQEFIDELVRPKQS